MRIQLEYLPEKFQILVDVIENMCGDPMLDLLYLAVPIALLGAGGLFFLKGSRKKIEEIFS